MSPKDLIIHAGWSPDTEEMFRSLLTGTARAYAPVWIAVGRRTGVSPCLIDAFCKRESFYGAYLKPKGPAGTGDFTPRKNKDGTMRTAPNGRGWGYGLFQWDYESFAAEIESLDWADPLVNCEVAMKDIFGGKLRFFRSPANAVEIKRYWTDGRGVLQSEVDDDLLVRCAVAAYNTGEGNVMRSLGKGRDIDATTADGADEDKDGDYSREVLTNALALAEKVGAA